MLALLSGERKLRALQEGLSEEELLELLNDEAFFFFCLEKYVSPFGIPIAAESKWTFFVQMNRIE